MRVVLAATAGQEIAALLTRVMMMSLKRLLLGGRLLLVLLRLKEDPQWGRVKLRSLEIMKGDGMGDSF